MHPRGAASRIGVGREETPVPSSCASRLTQCVLPGAPPGSVWPIATHFELETYCFELEAYRMA